MLKTFNFHLPNMSEKPILVKIPLPRPTMNKETAPCGGLTFFCLLSPSQDKKRRQIRKKNALNFHLPHDSENPISAKISLHRPTMNKEIAPFSSVRVGAYRIRPHSFLEK